MLNSNDWDFKRPDYLIDQKNYKAENSLSQKYDQNRWVWTFAHTALAQIHSDPLFRLSFRLFEWEKTYLWYKFLKGRKNSLLIFYENSAFIFFNIRPSLSSPVLIILRKAEFSKGRIQKGKFQKAELFEWPKDSYFS